MSQLNEHDKVGRRLAEKLVGPQAWNRKLNDDFEAFTQLILLPDPAVLKELALVVHEDIEAGESEPRPVTLPTPKKKSRGRGRPSDKEMKRDKRIFEAWRAGQYTKYADFGRELGLDEREVARIVDRHRKRPKNG